MLTGLLGNVAVRIAIYVVSTLVGVLPAWALSWIVIAFDGADWITLKISVQGFVTMLVSAFSLSGGVFAKYGIKVKR